MKRRLFALTMALAVAVSGNTMPVMAEEDLVGFEENILSEENMMSEEGVVSEDEVTYEETVPEEVVYDVFEEEPEEIQIEENMPEFDELMIEESEILEEENADELFANDITVSEDELFSDDLAEMKTGSSVSTQEVTIYTLTNGAAKYIQMPSNYRTTYSIKTDTAGATFRVISGNSVSVDAKGIVRPTGWYFYGSIGYMEPIEGKEPDSISYNSGKSTIQVTTGATSYNVVVNVVSYESIYADQKIDEWIRNHVTSGMTPHEKIEQACKMAASYDYSVYHSSAQGMIIYGGGDCWASTDLIIKFCQKLGYEAWGRNGNMDSGAGSGHYNALIKVDGKYYVAEAGYNMPAPRDYYLSERKQIFSYTFDSKNDGIKLYQYDGKGEATVYVPAEIDGRPVTSIGTSCFARGNAEEIKEIILPDTIKELNEFALGNCKYITSIQIPASLETIGRGAFSGCSSLKQIVVDSGNPYYTGEGGILYNKNKSIIVSAPAVSALDVPAGVSEIAAYAVDGNTNLQSVELNNVTVLREGAFARCGNITQIDLGNSLRVMEDFVFAELYTIKTLLVPDTISSIAANAFYASSITKLMANSSAYAKSYCEANNLTYVDKNHKHDYETTITKKPTLKETGIETHVCKLCEESYTTVLEKKKPIKINVSIKGNEVVLSWDDSNENDWFDIYEKIGDGKWTYWFTTYGCRETIDLTHFKKGKSYYFSVCDSDENEYDEKGTRVMVTDTPVISSLVSAKKGISLIWNAVTGAEQYRVLRKTDTTKWTKVADTRSTSFIDTTAKSGEVYFYSVRSVSADGKTYTSAGDTIGSSILRLGNTKVSALANTASGVKVSWNKVEGAAGYYIYRKAGNGSYVKIATVKKGTTVTYVDKSKLTNGAVYTYAVRAYKGVVKSTYTGLSIVRLARPRIADCSNTAKGQITVKWGRNKKASGYQVRYVLGSKTTKITIRKNAIVSSVINNLVKGNTYKVSVRSYKVSDGKKYYSPWSEVNSVKITK